MAKPTIGVHSGLVRTVLGPIPVEAIGVTLMHEHILLDASSWWKRPCCGSEIAIAERALDISMIGELRMNPFVNRDNCGLLDVQAAIEELNLFRRIWGQDRRRSDQPRNWTRSIRVAEDQPAKRA